MTGAERGLLLLCCRLDDPNAAPMTLYQFQQLRKRMREASMPTEERELTLPDLTALGLPAETGEKLLRLLDRDAALDTFLDRAANCGVTVVTRLSADYPDQLETRLRQYAPAVLFCKGDGKLLRQRGVALVGSRQLLPTGAQFARRVGELAAKEDYTLISGGAYGADQTAQKSATAHGGSAIVFTPDRLSQMPDAPRTLYVSEDGFDVPFSSARALARNRLIHALAEMTFVAQVSAGHGGTWRGAMDNLRFGWSPLYVCDDGSDGAQALVLSGAQPVGELKSLRALQSGTLFTD